MANRLTGKTAIITGANSGIGKATALLFASEGANVVLAARRPEMLEEVRQQIVDAGGNAICVATDVSDYEACGRLADAAAQTFGKIDILVNNAGIADKHRPVSRCEPDWWEHVINVDLTSVYNMTRQVLRYMEAQGSGSIVNVSSIGAVRGNSGAAYTAAKTGVLGLTTNLAIQYAGKGIRANAICPGPTPTALNTPDQIATFDAEFAAICNGHMDLTIPEVSAEDQAYACLYFASDDSKCVTGQVLTVDNGCSL